MCVAIRLSSNNMAIRIQYSIQSAARRGGKSLLVLNFRSNCLRIYDFIVLENSFMSLLSLTCKVIRHYSSPTTIFLAVVVDVPGWIVNVDRRCMEHVFRFREQFKVSTFQLNNSPLLKYLYSPTRLQHNSGSNRIGRPCNNTWSSR